MLDFFIFDFRRLNDQSKEELVTLDLMRALLVESFFFTLAQNAPTEYLCSVVGVLEDCFVLHCPLIHPSPIALRQVVEDIKNYGRGERDSSHSRYQTFHTYDNSILSTLSQVAQNCVIASRNHQTPGRVVILTPHVEDWDNQSGTFQKLMQNIYPSKASFVAIKNSKHQNLLPHKIFLSLPTCTQFEFLSVYPDDIGGFSLFSSLFSAPVTCLIRWRQGDSYKDLHLIGKYCLFQKKSQNASGLEFNFVKYVPLKFISQQVLFGQGIVFRGGPHSGEDNIICNMDLFYGLCYELIDRNLCMLVNSAHDLNNTEAAPSRTPFHYIAIPNLDGNNPFFLVKAIAIGPQVFPVPTIATNIHIKNSLPISNCRSIAASMFFNDKKFIETSLPLYLPGRHSMPAKIDENNKNVRSHINTSTGIIVTEQTQKQTYTQEETKRYTNKRAQWNSPISPISPINQTSRLQGNRHPPNTDTIVRTTHHDKLMRSDFPKHDRFSRRDTWHQDTNSGLPISAQHRTKNVSHLPLPFPPPSASNALVLPDTNPSTVRSSLETDGTVHNLPERHSLVSYASVETDIDRPLPPSPSESKARRSEPEKIVRTSIDPELLMKNFNPLYNHQKKASLLKFGKR